MGTPEGSWTFKDSCRRPSGKVRRNCTDQARHIYSENKVKSENMYQKISSHCLKITSFQCLKTSGTNAAFVVYLVFQAFKKTDCELNWNNIAATPYHV